MDVLNLLDRARAAGLTVRVAGDKLVIRGPKSAEPLVRELGAHKAELLALLAAEAITPATPHDDGPTPPCPTTDAPRSAEASTWCERYGDLDDAHYQAVVNADIARHGHYVPTRQYATPAEDPEAIWERAGLRVLQPLAVGDPVTLLRPDGGPVNVLDAWRIDHIVEAPEGKLAVFIGQAYASWPLAFCRRASEVRYPPARRGPGVSSYDLLREAWRRARSDNGRGEDGEEHADT